MVPVNLSNGMQNFQFKILCKTFISQKRFWFWIDFLELAAGDISF